MPPEPAPDLLDRLVHGGEHLRMLAHAEIVVGAPDGHAAPVALRKVVGRGVGPAAPFQVGEDAIAPLAMQRLKVLPEAILVVHPSPQSSQPLLPARPAGGVDIVIYPETASSRPTP